MNYFFTSDWHLSHKNLMIKLRPFTDIEEMNDLIINNFYSHVKGGDQVYFLGDFTRNKKVGLEFFKRKPKNIHFHFIYGNHDKKMWRNKDNLLKYCSSVQWIKDIKIDDIKITLCHYMMNSWNCSHWNAWHLFGHHHSQGQTDRSQGKSMNVCVDIHNFFPVSFEEVKQYMQNRPDNWDLIKKC